LLINCIDEVTEMPAPRPLRRRQADRAAVPEMWKLEEPMNQDCGSPEMIEEALRMAFRALLCGDLAERDRLCKIAQSGFSTMMGLSSHPAAGDLLARQPPPMAQDKPALPASVAQHEDFTIEYYEDGRFRLCLETSDANKIPKFRQAIDCVERILMLPTYPRQAEDIDEAE
jgi:hypothetical protein